MRRAMLSLLCLGLVGQDPTLLPAIQQVRVHPNQAWITREAVWTFRGPGSQRLRLTGLPPGLALDDIRVQADAIPGLRLGNVAVTQEDHSDPLGPELKALEAEQERLAHSAQDLGLRLQTQEDTLAWLHSLQPDAGPNPPAVLADPQAGIDLAKSIQTRAEELLAQSFTLRAEQKALQARQEATSQQLQAAKARAPRAASVVTLELESPAPGEARIQVQNRTPAARWRPAFEARLTDHDLELLCYASVSQASGEHWQGVGLEISNAEPARALRVPAPPAPIQLLYQAPDVIITGSLEGRITDRTGRPVAGVRVEAVSEALKVRPFVLSDGKGAFRLLQLSPGEYRVQASKAGYPTWSSFARVLPGQATPLGIQLMPTTASAVVEVVASAPSVDQSVVTTATSVRGAMTSGSLYLVDGMAIADALEATPAHYQESGELSRAWSLDGKRDLPADAQSRRVLLARTKVPAKLRLRAIPRSSSEVFRVAALPSSAGFPWFPGTTTTVFQSGEQIGRVSLPVLQPGEGALFSFGPVPGLRVQHQRLEATVATAKAGRGRQWTLRERVLLVNDLAQDVEVEVQEPNVRSGSDKLRVETLAGATPATVSGDRLTWLVKVPAHGQARIEEAWRITGPSTGSVPELAALGLPTSD